MPIGFSYRRYSILFAMICTALAAILLKPTENLSDHLKKINVAAMVPSQFGAWRERPLSQMELVDPQIEQSLNRTFTQTLSRTYTNDLGYAIMVSVAYIDRSNNTMVLHYPEICYPAQGFDLMDKSDDSLQTKFGTIPLKRLTMVNGDRSEPVSYWSTVGNYTVENRFDKKVKELRYGLLGFYPDGLVFRISSIDKDIDAAFEIQKKFAVELIEAMDSDARQRLAGLGRKI